MTKLLYVGRGRYLDGIPTADFETDDAQEIALCVDSGLYVTEGSVPLRTAVANPRPIIMPRRGPTANTAKNVEADA